MAEIIKMPRMSDTMEEGNIVEWMKKEGDAVEPGDLLAEIETDKATMEFESLWEGVLLHIAVSEGSVPVEGVIAVIGSKGEDWKAALEASNGDASSNGVNDAAEKSEPAVVAASSTPTNVPTSNADDGSRIKASPLAKSMATDAGIDISKVAGSGTQGRVVKRDIEEEMEKQTAPSSAPVPAPMPTATPAPAKETPPAPAVPAFSFSSEDAYDELPVSQMRKVIARRLGESKFSAPHFYLTVEVNMGKAMKWRKDMNAVAPTKISFNDLVVKAASVALRSHPAVNSSWMGDSIRKNHNVNIGVAVAVDEGLLVPVIRHADMKSLSQINMEVRALAGKARDRKLQPQEMSGNTFTISNLGMFGIEEFTAIINPPDACILAVGGINQKAIVENGELAVGNMMRMTLSCDHRVVDGAMGAQFMKTLKEILEEPIRLLV
ncbi:MAG: pyruvate dehydrogenase complex dihydrolipoamide acetyltransferase [Bacteroidetes bacterium]|jgi:pyruvate dehydrogenase E2 component (dihydrolipoamide acetyltransferase)|nr:pyruvate dehydrogenase complex dihydrolipoamide acetyltransferase [Bacteroidota bacterium]MDF1867475.1 pyruvate dehydrogenase complex dihydrolipoamide acetyltransferase [Saprospiraceae bacterium]